MMFSGRLCKLKAHHNAEKMPPLGPFYMEVGDPR